ATAVLPWRLHRNRAGQDHSGAMARRPGGVPHRHHRRHLALDAARSAGIDHRQRIRRRRIGIGRRLVLREVDVAHEIRSDRDELADVVDRELAWVIAGFGARRDGEECPRRQCGGRGDPRPLQHGVTLLGAARGRLRSQRMATATTSPSENCAAATISDSWEKRSDSKQPDMLTPSTIVATRIMTTCATIPTKPKIAAAVSPSASLPPDE